MKHHLWLMPVILLATALVYLPGLSGPFLFDDAPHIVHNTQVHVPDLSSQSLSRAWHSSLASGFAARPLAQLTFGVNHALTGLDAWWFKAVNLVIHLLAGVMVFVFTRELGRALDGKESTSTWVALFAAAAWLLHPLNLTPVLYVVQRMTSLSALFLITALWCHVRGRRALAEGNPTGFWLALSAWPLIAIGILAKESAALFPVFVLVLEYTLLRHTPSPRRRLLVLLSVVLPLTVGAWYLATHWGLTSHAGRPFSMVERVMTEARVVWLYVQMLLVPDLSVLGFHHDDIAISRSLLEPPSTLLALGAWGVTIGLALIGARRWPVPSFGVLFFLAGHLLESTIIPLELVFEHRNYVPSIGPIFALSWLIGVNTPAKLRRLLPLLAVVCLAVLAALTNLRALDWSNEQRLIAQEVRHHPNSPRANFRAAQLYIGAIQRGDLSPAVVSAAYRHLEAVRRMSPTNVDALFGQLFLDLILEKDPPPGLIADLTTRLESGVVGPTQLSLAQFSYLVKWQLSAGAHHLAHADALAILTAPLDNPRMNAQGKASILSALRAYHDRVLDDPNTALPYAQAAVKTWPARWHYHYRLVQVLLRLGRLQEASDAFARAAALPSAQANRQQVDELRRQLGADPTQRQD